MGSFIFLSATDFSINMISMFAFIVTLGIVVDDAVVVGENIYHWRRKGLPTLQAAVAGTREVAMPVVFSVLTNLVAFMPLMFVPGFMGKIFKVIPLVVAAVFGVSLIESLFILPAHLGHRTRQTPIWPLNYLERWQERFSQAFERFVRNRYGDFLPSWSGSAMACCLRHFFDVGFGRLCGLGAHGAGDVSPKRVGLCLRFRNPALRDGRGAAEKH